MRPSNFREQLASSDQVFTIGVAGDSGSGKTTFTRAIRAIFGPELVATITLDDYHRYDREERRRLGITPLVPEANDLDLLAEHVRYLKDGKSVMKPVYDHTAGTFADPVPFSPARVLILEGLHTFFTPHLRSLLDFSLFVDPDPEVKRLWKLRRDMERRGYRKEEVLAEMEARIPDYERYIAPQRGYADAVIGIACSGYGREVTLAQDIYQVTLYQNPLVRQTMEIGLSIDLGEVLMLSDRPFTLRYEVATLDDREMSAITLDGALNHSSIRKLARTIGRQTSAEGVEVYKHRRYLTAGEVVELILAWRIINRWFVLTGGEGPDPFMSGREKG